MAPSLSRQQSFRIPTSGGRATLLPDNPVHVCPLTAQAHGPAMNELVQKLCVLHEQALEQKLLPVVDMIEELMPSTSTLIGLTMRLALETHDHLRGFHFLRRYRKLDERQMALVLEQIEASERPSVQLKGKRSKRSFMPAASEVEIPQ